MVWHTLVTHKIDTVRPLEDAPLVHPLLLTPESRNLLCLLARLQLPEAHLLMAFLGGARGRRDGHLLPVFVRAFAIQLCLLPF